MQASLQTPSNTPSGTFYRNSIGLSYLWLSDPYRDKVNPLRCTCSVSDNGVRRKRFSILISSNRSCSCPFNVILHSIRVKFGDNQELTKGYSIVVVIFNCLFVVAFGWSWGPLGWTIPSEIFPLETRSAGQSITVAVNLLFTFIIAQAFLSMLCAFKLGIFLFFAGWVSVMTIVVYFLLPETKGVTIEEMTLLWKKHCFWKKSITCNKS
ncbi:hypothetical protein N665_1055s0003 [Sinapis alba]|nr:hypothetical protein N665_1055s0003 [Sinapis alba]